MIIPKDWTFQNADVAAAFDAHVREQLPWYELATQAVAQIGRHYIPRDGLVYDIGASTGNIGIALGDTLAARNAKFIAIDNSADIARLYRGPGTIQIADALDIVFEPFDLAVCFLVLMFLTIEQRAVLLRKLAAATRKGGGIVIIDKCLPANSYAGVARSRLTLAGKIERGAQPGDVLAKELSLAGIQRPLGIGEIDDNAIEFFRYGDFAGWILEAPLSRPEAA